MATFSLRIKDTEYDKLKIISENLGRSINKEIEQLIYQHIKDYEKLHGKIEDDQLELFQKRAP